MTNKLWEESIPLACPKLRYNEQHASWVSKEGNPCDAGDCWQRGCRNYMDKYDNPDRLMIVVDEQ